MSTFFKKVLNNIKNCNNQSQIKWQFSYCYFNNCCINDFGLNRYIFK